MHWDIPKGYYIARAWLTAAAYGDLETISGYTDYEMAEAHHDLEGTESYGERRYGGTRGGWFDETANARGHPDTDPEPVRTFVDARPVGDTCSRTEPRDWGAAESEIYNVPVKIGHVQHEGEDCTALVPSTGVAACTAGTCDWCGTGKCCRVTGSSGDCTPEEKALAEQYAKTSLSGYACVASLGAREFVFPAPRDYTSHTYTTPNKTLESYDTDPVVPASAGEHNMWDMCVDRLDITAQLKSRTGPHIEVTMATSHPPRGHPTRFAGTQNAGRQASERGTYRFKARATLFLHLAPENSLKPYLGPAFGATHVHIRPECLMVPAHYDPDLPYPNAAQMEITDNTSVVCVFGAQPEWQGGYRSGRGEEVLATLDDDGAVNCISPDMSGNAAATSANAIDNWQQVVVYHNLNGTGVHYERISHALGFYIYRHAPRNKAVRHGMVEPDLEAYRGSSVFSHNQGPALMPGSTVGLGHLGGRDRDQLYKGNQFEYGERRRQVCPDPTDTDC